MLKKISFKQFQDFANQTWQRFPLSILCSLLLIVLFQMDFYEDPRSNISCLLIAGFFIFGFWSLVSEHKQWSFFKSLFFSIPCLILVYYYFFHVNPKNIERYTFFAGLFLSLTATPLFNKNKSPENFWRFNYVLGISIAWSVLFSFILVIGYFAIVAALDVLFNFGVNDLESFFFQEIVHFIAFFLAPIYTIYQLPRSIDTCQQDRIEINKPLNILINWTLLPIIFIYLSILYAYILSIVLNWQLPNGKAGHLILWFTFSGLSVYLITWPFYKGSKIISKIFLKAFFPLLILPSVLLLYALYIRVQEYGITENRYLPIVIGIWALCLGIFYCIIRNRKEIIYWITPSIAVLLILSSFGPWSIFNVTVASQKNSFERFLISQNLLKNGVWIGNEIDKKDYVQIRDRLEKSLTFFIFHDRFNKIAPWFATHPHVEKIYELASDPSELKYEVRYQQTQNIYKILLNPNDKTFSKIDQTIEDESKKIDHYTIESQGNRLSDKTILDIAGYDYLTQINIHGSNKDYIHNRIIGLKNQKFPLIQLNFELDERYLIINYHKSEKDTPSVLKIDMAEFTVKNQHRIPENEYIEKSTLAHMGIIEAENDILSTKLVCEKIKGASFINRIFEIRQMNCLVLIRDKDKNKDKVSIREEILEQAPDENYTVIKPTQKRNSDVEIEYWLF